MSFIVNSTLAFYGRSTSQMSTLRREAEVTQARIATGKRLERSSDDPVAASRLRSLARADRLGAIDAANAARAKDNLSLASGVLSSIGQDILRTRELALWAASETLSSQDRANIGQEIAQLRDTILANLNASDGSGQPLFAGETGAVAYQLDAAGNATYVGANVSGTIALGDGQSVTRGVTGPEIVELTAGGVATDLLAVMKTLADTLQGLGGNPTAAAQAAVGELDGGLEALTRSQTIVGTRLAWIETVQDRQTAKAEHRAAEQAETGGVDLASTIVDLQQKLTVLEASQASFTRLSALSLFSKI